MIKNQSLVQKQLARVSHFPICNSSLQNIAGQIDADSIEFHLIPKLGSTWYHSVSIRLMLDVIDFDSGDVDAHIKRRYMHFQISSLRPQSGGHGNPYISTSHNYGLNINRNCVRRARSIGVAKSPYFTTFSSHIVINDFGISSI